MRIEYALPAKAIDSLADGSYVVLGIESNRRMVPQFPTVVAIPLLICIVASHVEAQPGIQHLLTGSVLDDAMQPAGQELNVPFGMTPGPNTPEGWEVRSQLAVVMAFEATAAGTYTITLAADEQSRSVPIIVVGPE